jgi:hypothetical protein
MSRFLLDTDILSIFAKAGALPLLCDFFQCQRLPMTSGVFDELLIPLEYGYDFPQRILDLAEVVTMTPEEAQDYEALRLQGKLSAADAELIAICGRRGWAYVAMDRVALRCAEQHGVRTIDLQALLKAMLEAKLLDRQGLQALIERMEREDHTTLPYKESLLETEGS